MSDIGGGGYWTRLLDIFIPAGPGGCPNLTYGGHTFTHIAWPNNASGLYTDDVNLPAAIASGDLLLVFAGKCFDDGFVDAPPGWTLAMTDADVSGAAGYYRIADGTEGATVSWTINGNGAVGDGGTNLRWYIAARYATDGVFGGYSILGGSPPFADQTGYAVVAAGGNAAEATPVVFSDPSSDAWLSSGQLTYITGLILNEEDGPDDAHTDALFTDRGVDSVTSVQFVDTEEYVLLADVLNRTTVDATDPTITWEGGTFVDSFAFLTFLFVCAGAAGGGGECAIDAYGDLINDDFADALALTVTASSFAFTGGFPPLHTPLDGETTIGATKEVGEPDHNGNTGGHSIWFSLVPDATGVWYIEVDGNGSDSVGKAILIGVYTGASVGALTEITYDVTAPDYTAGFGSANACDEIIPFSYLEATLTSGTTYYIAVDIADGETVKAVRLQGNLE